VCTNAGGFGREINRPPFVACDFFPELDRPFSGFVTKRFHDVFGALPKTTGIVQPIYLRERPFEKMVKVVSSLFPVDWAGLEPTTNALKGRYS
jgi:hypothetical protein